MIVSGIATSHMISNTMDTVLPYAPIDVSIQITEALQKQLQEIAKEIEGMDWHDFDPGQSSKNSRRLIIDVNTGTVFIEVGGSA